MESCLSVCLTLSVLCLVVVPAYGDLAATVKSLQAQVKTLEEARLRDQLSIRLLSAQLVRTESPALRVLEKEHRSLAQLEVQLRSLKQNLAEMVNAKERELRGVGEMGDVRVEYDSLRTEVLKLRQELESQRARHEEDMGALGQVRATQVTAKWLQKSVEELRKEMSEMASVLNVSVSLKQRQQLETNFSMVHADLRSIRSEFEDLRAHQQRASAALVQLKEEGQEMRRITQQITGRNQQIGEQVRNLQDEVSNRHYENDVTTSLNGDELGSGDDRLIYKTDDHSFHVRHHRRLKTEVAHLSKTMSHVFNRQKNVEKKLKKLQFSHETLNATMGHLVSSAANAKNESHRDFHHYRQILERVSTRLETMETQSHAHAQNVSEVSASLDKLHESTVQLFEALETIEEDHDKNVGDLQKDITKFDFNLAQTQATCRVLRDDLTNQQETQKVLKKDVALLRGEVQRDHYQLLLLQNEVLNSSLHECTKQNEEVLRDLRLTSAELKIQRLESRVNRSDIDLRDLRSLLHKKADGKQMENFKMTLQDLSTLRNKSMLVREELAKFRRRLPRDCTMSGVITPPNTYHSGIYLIQVHNTTNEVYCDMTNGSHWTIIQRRTDGSVNFFRDWQEYKQGFGDPSGEYWLGNENLHRLTTSEDYVLRVEMKDTQGRFKYAEYSTFRVLSESDSYRLVIGGYQGNASDALAYHNEMAFSTRDRDNDASSTHCAVYYASGWWYNHCQYVNINGKYNIGLTWYDIDAHEWIQLDSVVMKVRPVHFTGHV